jgi:hypothetical protein
MRPLRQMARMLVFMVAVHESPAEACTCFVRPLAQRIEESSVIVRAIVQQVPDACETMCSYSYNGLLVRTVPVVLDVSSVYKGEALEHQLVVQSVDPCDDRPPENQEGIFFLNFWPDTEVLVASTCGETIVGTDIPEAESQLNAAYVPLPGQSGALDCTTPWVVDTPTCNLDAGVTDGGGVPDGGPGAFDGGNAGIEDAGPLRDGGNPADAGDPLQQGIDAGAAHEDPSPDQDAGESHEDNDSPDCACAQPRTGNAIGLSAFIASFVFLLPRKREARRAYRLPWQRAP